MRILLMGAKGMLGRDMLRVWKSDDVIAADIEEADIRDLQQVRNLFLLGRGQGRHRIGRG